VKVVSVVGARPQLVKLAPIAAAMGRTDHVHKIVHTGQHYDADLSDVFFAGLGIPDPDLHLGVGSGSHGAQTGAMLTALDPIAEDGVQFTKANRFYARSSSAGMPSHRVFGNVVLSVMTKFSSGYYHLFDPQNGYTALHRDALARIDLDAIAGNYSFENSLLIHLNVLRVRARDVPIPAVYGEEVSGMRLRRVVPMLLRTLVAGFWLRIYRKYVFPSFGPFALLFFGGLILTGLGLGAAIVITVLAFNDVTASPATVMISVAPLLDGIQLLVSALIVDMQESPD
jgi:hypothetical protein